jgi:hypothetical protein
LSQLAETPSILVVHLKLLLLCRHRWPLAIWSPSSSMHFTFVLTTMHEEKEIKRERERERERELCLNQSTVSVKVNCKMLFRFFLRYFNISKALYLYIRQPQPLPYRLPRALVDVACKEAVDPSSSPHPSSAITHKTR